MLFNSFEFFLFLPVVLVLYWTVLRSRRLPLLLVASYVFYGAWDWRFLGLLLLSTITDFQVGKWLERSTDPRSRRLGLVLSLFVNLGVLAFFKYFNFFIDSAVSLFGDAGLNIDGPALRIVLPVGISFYTFQTLAYTIDVYRGKAAAEHHFMTFAVYVSFFPQLVAGPIERAQRLIPQLVAPASRFTYERFRAGAFLILLGLFKKVAIADGLAPYVEQAFGGSAEAGWIQLVVGVYAFAFQIYGDFSGYTDIARGAAQLLGIDLMINFNQPYLSRNITNFWRTWHISLSTWLRDYLYIPLGGNRRGGLFTYRNLMITMLLGGLWHGAAWTFVVWGALHGVYLAAHRRFRSRSPREATDRFIWRDILPAFATFQLVALSWIFFRADSFTQAFEVLGGIASLRPGPVDVDALIILAIFGTATIAIDLVQRNKLSHTHILSWPAAARGFAYATMAIAVFVFAGDQPVPFIYFQF